MGCVNTERKSNKNMKSYNFINNYIFTISDEFNDILAVDTITASAKFYY